MRHKPQCETCLVLLLESGNPQPFPPCLHCALRHSTLNSNMSHNTEWVSTTGIVQIGIGEGG